MKYELVQCFCAFKLPLPIFYSNQIKIFFLPYGFNKTEINFFALQIKINTRTNIMSETHAVTFCIE